MTTEFITHEQWLSLEELGFEEPCIGWYNPQSDYKEITTDHYWAFHLSGDWQNFIPAPLKSQVFRWFREKHNILSEIEIDKTAEPKYCFTITRYFDFGNYEKIKMIDWFLYRTYEEAENACIDALIQLLKK